MAAAAATVARVGPARVVRPLCRALLIAGLGQGVVVTAVWAELRAMAARRETVATRDVSSLNWMNCRQARL